MPIIIALASILGLTILAWSVKRFFPLRLRSGQAFLVCPICVGVAGTWVWLLVAPFWGYRIDLAVLAMLMGGTVVGAMSKLERLIESRFVLVWKTIFVISGFWAVNSLIASRWLWATVGIILVIIATLAAKMQKIDLAKEETERVGKLKDKMKNCC